MCSVSLTGEKFCTLLCTIHDSLLLLLLSFLFTFCTTCVVVGKASRTAEKLLLQSAQGFTEKTARSSRGRAELERTGEFLPIMCYAVLELMRDHVLLAKVCICSTIWRIASLIEHIIYGKSDLERRGRSSAGSIQDAPSTHV